MSAYICDKRHILYLIHAATSRRIMARGGTFRWVWNCNRAAGSYESATLPCGDPDRAAEVANMLWRENVASVSARYPGESSGTLPGPRGGSFVITAADVCQPFEPTPDPVQVLKSCDCYSYQSCEHDGWPESEAHAFIQALQKAAWQSLPGYDKATWGAPEKPTRKMEGVSL